MKNIFLLDTDKESYLYSMSDGKLYISDLFEKGSSAWRNQFIYITNKEDIQNGDYVIVVGNSEWKTKVWKRIHSEYYTLDGQPCMYDESSEFLKVCLTNDTSLIEEGVQAVDNLFLSFYAENQPDYVEVTKGFADGTTYGYNFLDYKLNFPQKSLEHKEALKIGDVTNFDTITDIKENTIGFGKNKVGVDIWYKRTNVVKTKENQTSEKETLEKIKFALSCGNDAQAIRFLHLYGDLRESVY